MRVPRPAAGMMTNTFMAVCQYTGATLEVQTPESRPDNERIRTENRRTSGSPSSDGWLYDDVGGFVSTIVFVEIGVGVVGTTGTVGVVGDTGTACREYDERSSHLPKIILPAVVCRTEVTEKI